MEEDLRKADKDFGELVFRLSKPSSGVILFTTNSKKDLNRYKVLLNTVDVKDKFIVLKDNVVKIRKIR